MTLCSGETRACLSGMALPGGGGGPHGRDEETASAIRSGARGCTPECLGPGRAPGVGGDWAGKGRWLATWPSRSATLPGLLSDLLGPPRAPEEPAWSWGQSEGGARHPIYPVLGGEEARGPGKGSWQSEALLSEGLGGHLRAVAGRRVLGVTVQAACTPLADGQEAEE